MKTLLGKKIGMTQLFMEDGRLVPVTAIEAGPCVVIQVKTPEKDGYSAVQLGYGEIKKGKRKKVSKPLKGHFARAKVSPQQYLAEVPVDEGGEYKVGQKLTADVFSEGEYVDVTGVSKGKGFAGVVKRWGFRGGPSSHGSHFHRTTGSIGGASTPSRVFKGKKMPGHLGQAKAVVQNLEVVKIEPELNLILVKGAVPGAKNSQVVIRASVKGKAPRKKPPAKEKAPAEEKVAAKEGAKPEEKPKDKEREKAKVEMDSKPEKKKAEAEAKGKPEEKKEAKKESKEKTRQEEKA